MLTVVIFNPVLPKVRYSRLGVFSVFAKEGPAFKKGPDAIPKRADEAVFTNFRRPIFFENITRPPFRIYEDVRV
jgi:hypothetical protein